MPTFVPIKKDPRFSSGVGTFVPITSKRKKKGKSVGGFLGNVVSDIQDTVYGIPAATKMVGEVALDTSPILAVPRAIRKKSVKAAVIPSKKTQNVGKQVAKSYKKTYGPLVRGEWSKFANNLYDDGFFIAGDVLTVASAGTGALAKAPVMGAKVATAGKTMKLATGGGKTVEKALSSKPFRGNVQRGADKVAKKAIPQNTPVVGEFARAGKTIQRDLQRPMETNVGRAIPAQKAVVRLRGDEAVAAVLLRDLPLPKDLDSYIGSLKARGTKEAIQAATLLEKPRVQQLYRAPETAGLSGRRVMRAADELGGLVSENERILGSMLGESAKTQRPYLHTLLARGAKFVTPEDVRTQVATARNVAAAEVKNVQQEIRVLRSTYYGERGTAIKQERRSERLATTRGAAERDAIRNQKALNREPWLGRIEEDYGAAARADIDRLYAEIARENDVLDAAREGARARGVSDSAYARMNAAKERLGAIESSMDVAIESAQSSVRTLRPPPGFASVDEAITGIKQELKAAGRSEPIYIPDTSEFTEVVAEISPRGGGSAQAGANLLRSAQSQDLGVLFQSGQRVIDPTALVNKYLWNTKQAHYLDIHNELMKHADEITDGRIPEGYEIVRKPTRPFAADVAGKEQQVGRGIEQIPYTIKKGADYQEWMQKHLPADSPFTTVDIADAAVGPKGGILVVPSELARGVKGEFTRMGKFAYTMNRGPVRVWRAAVLNLRPAWLVNNIVGNSLMYAISNLDAQGLRSLNEMFKKRYPQHAGEFDSILDQHFARQRNSATFIGTQRPSYGGRNQARRALSKAVGSLADVDKWWESGLRRAAVKAEMRRNPALKQAVSNMRSETTDFWQAANKSLDDNPALVQQIENRVNDALGNFTNMSNFEKNYMRTIFPFWAWYRAIVGVTLKLPLDQPIKYQLLSRLAPIGVDANLEAAGLQKEDAPAFLRGFIPLGKQDGGDRMKGLATSGANPFGTTLEMGKLTAALAMWQPGELGQALPGVNPFFMQAGEAIFGTDVRGAPANRVPGIGPLNIPFGVYADFPQVRLVEAYGVNADPSTEPYQGTDAKPRLYDQDPEDLLLRFLGVPYARVSKTRAKQMTQK